ncbi:MAG TPA: hypothetical protein PLY72_21395, partial [Candidatus Obscuribacter sp.]|nr:hypothetical protein [Candidatus Obscuribacter sp.]
TSAPGKRASASRTRADTTYLTRASTSAPQKPKIPNHAQSGSHSHFGAAQRQHNKSAPRAGRTTYGAPASDPKEKRISISFLLF